MSNPSPTTSKKPTCLLIHHHLSSDLSDSSDFSELSDSSDTLKAPCLVDLLTRWLVDCFFKKCQFFEKTPLKNLQIQKKAVPLHRN